MLPGLSSCSAFPEGLTCKRRTARLSLVNAKLAIIFENTIFGSEKIVNVAENFVFLHPMRLTANQRKLIASLQTAKGRRAEGLFIVEGLRSLREMKDCFEPVYLVATAGWLEENQAEASAMVTDEKILLARPDEIERMSSMSTPQGVIGVFRLPKNGEVEIFPDKDELILALDRVQDPGNLGTIIRLADWFGIQRILASEDTVDAFNPKVVQSTMGALARVQIVYCDLPLTLSRLKKERWPIYGTFLDGNDLYSSPLTEGGVVVMGNEGNGISPEVASVVTERIRIPSYPADAATVESLNVGVAAAVTVAEFRRRAPLTSNP